MSETITLPDLPDGSPAGPSLELDATFGEMERAAQGKPESQYGNTIEPATPPDWKETARLAEELLGRTRDLRVMVTLAIARLHLQGFQGFAPVLSLIRQQIESGWEHVHPQLDPEDDNDPMQRANALLALRNPIRVLRPMRELPLAGTPRTGPVCWRDIAVANGTMEQEPGHEKVSEAAIRAAFAGTDPARRAALRAAVGSALTDATAIPVSFDARSSAGSGPDLQDLVKLLRDVQKELSRYESLVAEPAADAPEPGEAAGGAGDGGGGGGGAGGSGDMAETAVPVRAARGPVSIQSITAVANRNDALHAMELAAAYFRSNEPSSPVPMLVDRAKRLATLPFLDILRDLAPDGLTQAQVIAGPQEE